MKISDSSDFVDATPKPPRSKVLLAWMIVSQILGIIPILALAGFGIFGILLDGKINFRGFVEFLSPLFMLIPLAGSWFAYSKRNEKLAWLLTSVPVLYVCLDIMIFGALIFTDF